MIPKIIHYCWFGNNAKPKNVEKCIQTWKDVLPDYRFIEWNEKNFDITYNKFTLEAYAAKKYAFVSDVARLKALYEYGGIYLDTDVIVYKTFDFILKEKCVFGFEEKQFIATSFMACEQYNEFIKCFLDYYFETKFGDMETNVVVVTNLLEKRGLKRNDEKQLVDENIAVFPQEFFSPYDYINCVMKKTNQTICVHLYYVSWAKKSEKFSRVMKSFLVKIIGVDNMERLRQMIGKG